MKAGEFTGQWDRFFREAHLTSGPGRAGLTVSKANPSPDRGSRSVYREDREEVLRAAEKYGYRLVLETSAVATFSHPALMGELR